MIILDTDHVSALQYRDAPRAFSLQARLETLSPDEIATTVITIEEQTRGWLGLIRRYSDVHRQVAYYERLVRLFGFLPNGKSCRLTRVQRTSLSDCGSKEFVLERWTSRSPRLF